MRVFFVCTGNVCRSPLAEHLFRKLLTERGVTGVEVASSGIHAREGMPTIDPILRAGAAAGLDLSRHRAQVFKPGAIASGDLIFVMEENHRRQILSQAVVEPRSVRLLGRFGPPGDGDEVADPLGGPDEAYAKCVERIRGCLEGVAAWLDEERISRA